VPTLPNIGQLMLASFIPSVHTDINNWWIGEKFDGMRACWNPLTKILYSKRSLPIRILSQHFLMMVMVNIFLEGELWIGRASFKFLKPIFSNKNNTDNFSWNLLKIILFDVPNSDSQECKLIYERRYSILLSNVPIIHPFLINTTRLKCRDRKYMDNYTRHIIKRGGEGVILRKPGSLYEHGRSHLLLKYKVLRDGEALLVSILKPSNYICQLPNGKVFTSQKKRNIGYSLKIGELISFKFSHISPTTGLPVQAIIYRRRGDMSWDDVLLQEEKIT